MNTNEPQQPTGDSLGDLADTLGGTYIDGRTGHSNPPEPTPIYQVGDPLPGHPAKDPANPPVEVTKLAGQDEPAAECPHQWHTLDTPASWLPTRGHAILTRLLMPLALGLGAPVAALGTAEDGGPLLCCCDSLNVAEALRAGAIVAVPSTTHTEHEALRLLGPSGTPVETVAVTLNEPGQPPVFVFGISQSLRDALAIGATLGTIGEVTRDADGGQA